MGCRPFGPFAVKAGEAPPPEPEWAPALKELGLYEVATAYRSLFLRTGGAMGPRQVDELEWWEVEVLATATYPKSDKDGSKTSSRPAPVQDDAERYRLIRERILFERGEGPPPTVRPVSNEVLQSLGEALA